MYVKCMHMSKLKNCCFYNVLLPYALEIGGTAGLEFPQIPTQNPGRNTKSLLGNKFLAFNQRDVPFFRNSVDPSFQKIQVLNPVLSFVM